MYGLSISLLMDTEQLEVDVNSNLREFVPNLIWSEYDRIYINKINDFSDFFVVDSTVSQWTGSIQTLHLYSNQPYEKAELKTRKKTDRKETDILYSDSNPDRHYPLAMIMSLKINELIFSECDIEKNNNIVKKILDKLGHLVSDCPIQSFFSLGEEDVVFIVLGNSIDDFMSIIEAIRSMSFMYKNEELLVCNFTNTFLIQNSQLSEKIDCKKAVANVYISLNKGINEVDFLNAFKNQLGASNVNLIDASVLIGEYDVVLKLHNTNDCLFDLYYEHSGNSLLNADSSFYKKYIKNSKTIWCMDLISSVPHTLLFFDDEHFIAPKTTLNNLRPNINVRIQDILIKLSKKVSNNKNTQYVYHNISFFLKDAAIAFNSATTTQWKEILSNQIEAFIDIFETFDEYYTQAETEYYKEQYLIDLNKTITDMRNSFSHINRSHELFYHTPISSLHYLGSFNNILLAYYNYISNLLELAFEKPHAKGTQQANIVFFVYFGMTSKIRSKIYLNNMLDPNGVKLVSFELPYAALYDLRKYFISLTHEVYHLIAPYDRKRRNKILEKIYFDFYLKNEFQRFIIQTILYQGNDKNINIDEDGKEALCELINLFFDSRELTPHKFDLSNLDFSSVFNEINNNILNNRKQLTEWYAEMFSEFIQFCVQRNFIDEKLNNIRKHLAEIHPEKYTYDFDLNVDYGALNKTKSVLSAIRECICDTFMYQMSFKIYKDGIQRYLKYMINFFEERGVNYEDNIDIIYRLGAFLEYIECDVFNLQLEDPYLYKIKKIYSQYCKSFSVKQRRTIKAFILSEDFLYASKTCYSEDKFIEIVTKEKLFSETINFITQKNTFEQHIKLLLSLNHHTNNLVTVKNDVNSEIDLLSNIIKIDSEHNHCQDLIPTHYVKDLNDYLVKIKDGHKVGEVWFRGICNSKYHLIPSIYVSLPKHTFPYQYQISLIKQAYSETKKNYHIFAKHENPHALRQSLLQHYGVPTNLLDFSTDPLSALYWALNPENENDKKNLTPAVVYMFYPHRYQKACNYIQQYYKCKGSEFFKYNYAIHTHNCLNSDYIIDDISDDALIKKLKKFTLNTHKYKFTKTKYCREKILYNKLPIPIVIPQKNDRILAQSGTFVAFNLSCINNGQGYDFIALDNILNKYIDLCTKNNDDYTENCFLERIIINKYNILSIRETLNETFKYSRESVYPDLENQLKYVKNTVNKIWGSK